MRKFLLFIFCLSIPYSFADDTVVEEEVFVTATYHEQPLTKVLGATVVIDNAEIFKTQPAGMPEILEQQSGAQIVRSGGRASQTSLFTRGTNSDHTLVLIDGMRFGSVSNGQTQLQFIDPEQIERIEYFKGSRSSLYGSDAIGGVLQIFTLSPPQERKSYLTAQAGSHASRRFAGGIKDSVDQFYYSGAISHETSDGIDNLVDDTGFNQDDDPYHIFSGNFGAGYVIDDQTDVSIRHFESRTRADYDSSPRSGDTDQPYSKENQRATSVMLKSKPVEFYSTKLTLGHSRENSENLNRQDEQDQSEFLSKRRSAFWLNSFHINDAITWDAGVDYNRESVESTTEYQDSNGAVVTSRNNTGLFTQVDMTGGPFSAQFGFREDDSSVYGASTTGNAAFGFALHEAANLYISWAEGFKAPTFNDLYWPMLGNENLLPESSESHEFGVKGNYSQMQYSASVFSIDIENLIDWSPDDEGIWQPRNINAAEIEGAEISLSASIKNFSLASTFSYTEALDAASGDLLDNRAKTKFTLNLSQSFGEHSAGILLKVVGKRETSGEDRLPGYGTLGVYVTSKISKQLIFRIKVNNIFDREYQVDERYNEDGLNANAKITYQF